MDNVILCEYELHSYWDCEIPNWSCEKRGNEGDVIDGELDVSG